MTFGRHIQVNVLVSSSEVSDTTPQSAVSFNGVTFTFDRAMPVGTFVTGEPFVVSDQSFAITAISPASAIQNGGIKNGAVRDAFVNDAEGQEQGFDAFIGSGGSGTIAYNNTLNIDPGNTGQDIDIAFGEETTITKAVRLPSVTSDGEWQTVEKYVPLTVLADAPPVNCFRPTMSGTTKRLYTTADVDLSVFRSLTFPPAWTDTPESLFALLPDDPGNWGAAGERHRRLRLDSAAGLGSSNYSAAIVDAYSKACMVMHNGAFDASRKQALLYKLISWGIQLEGVYDRGWRGIGGVGSGAGQASAWQPYFWLTAFALKSASMLAKVQGMKTPFDNCYWMTAERLTIDPNGNDSGASGTAFFEEHIGVPFCSSSRDFGPQVSSRYGDVADYANMWEGPPIFLLQNGPGGETGFSARNQGAYGTSNDKSAIWARLDRTAITDPWPTNSYGILTLQRALWETTCRDAGVYTPWTGPPVSPYFGAIVGEGAPGDFFTPVSGGYSWNFAGYDYATEPKTDREFGYSLDGTQFIAVQGVNDIDSLTGLLPGVSHHLYFRWESASGWGAQVPNVQFLRGANELSPNIFATGGSGSASAPAFTVNPVICQKKNAAWGDYGGNWEAAPAALDKNTIELKCGQGYVDGDADPSFTYQWTRNGTPISGATDQIYTLQAADAGATIACEITPSNAAGTGATVATAMVSVPALTSLPAGTLIDTDFKGGFALDYADEIASIITTKADALHMPVALPLFDDRINIGALMLDKTASNPNITFDLSEPADPGTTYTVSGQLLVLWASSSGTYFVEIEEVGGGKLGEFALAGGGDLEPTAVQYSPAGQNVSWGLRNFSFQVTTGSNTALRVKIRGGIGSGGGSGADMFLTELRIAES